MVVYQLDDLGTIFVLKMFRRNDSYHNSVKSAHAQVAQVNYYS